MNFNDVVVSHTRWKFRLRDHLDGKSTEKLDPRTIEREDACVLGEWIEAEAAYWSRDPDFAALRDAHARFHREAAAIVRAIDSGDRTRAETMLGVASTYTHLSADVVDHIRRLRQKAERKAA